MYRAALVLLIAAPVGAAPTPREIQQEALYFPTKVGTKLVYEVSDGNSKGDFSFTVSRVEPKGKALRVTLESDRGTIAPSVTEVSAEGVTELRTGLQDLDAPRVVLKLPAKPGDTWARKASDGDTPSDYTVGKLEEIEVPAGKFNAIPVVCKPAKGETGSTFTRWYAPRVGLVKCSATNKDQKILMSLKSFTVPPL